MLKLIDTHCPESDKFVYEQLKEHNANRVGRDKAPVSLYFKNENHDIVAGLTGRTQWGALVIEILWVHQDYRGQSLGERLINRATEVALQQSCQNMVVETMGFQAKDFYLKQGFEIFGVVDHSEPAFCCYYLKKML